MTFTSHGHHIPGTSSFADIRPKTVARCGGPRTCGECKEEAVAILSHDSIASADLREDLAALTAPVETN